MTPLIILALIVGLPVLLTFLLRANASIVFLALCAGSVLAQFVSGDSSSFFNSVIPANGTINYSIVQLSLLFAPAFFTIIFMRKTVKGPKAMVNIVPAVATGVVGALLAVPLLPGGVQHNIVTTNLWQSIEQYQSVVVSVSVVISLFTLWFTKPKHDKKGKHR